MIALGVVIMNCNPAVNNTSGNLSTPPVDQRIVYVEFLFVYKFYVAFGTFAIATNLISIVVVLSNKQMREKYASFGMLSFGDLINAISLVLAGAVRSNLIEGNLLDSLFIDLVVRRCGNGAATNTTELEFSSKDLLNMITAVSRPGYGIRHMNTYVFSVHI